MQDKQHEIPGVVRVEPGNGGLSKIAITAPQASAEIYLHGAHVTHFQPAGQQPVIWMSRSSYFDSAKPIRGGVPICFPWFGPRPNDAKAPGHGFVRLRDWSIESIRQQGANVEVTLAFASDEGSRNWWPADFAIKHIITVGQTLEMKLEIENRSKEPIRFDEALHTYFTISDIRNVWVEGLGGVKYVDKMDGAKTKAQSEPQIRFSGETDRVYFDTQSTCLIHDPGMKRKIEVSKSGSNDTVVWNPWINKARAMPDFHDEEWPGMLCIETANVAKNAIELAPGKSHAVIQRVRVV